MVENPHRILFLTSNLGGGGAERALVDIINHLDRSRFNPHLALFQKEGPFLNELAPDVPVYEIQSIPHGFIRRNLVRFRGIRYLVSEIQPSLIMSMLWQVNAVVLLTSLFGDLGVPIIINEQSVPGASLRFDRRRRMLWPIVKWTYRKAHQIIVISKGIACELDQDLRISKDKINVIHNPVTIPAVEGQDHRSFEFKIHSKPAIMAAGRLNPLKNYPMLLQAFSLVSSEHDVELYILGQGPEKNRIETLADSLGISSKVHLLGFVSDPRSYLSQADIFVLTSNHEGFGNVLIEAMSLGVPVIATDCPYGPREILDNGKYGILVPVGDESAFADAISYLLNHPEERLNLAESGLRRSTDFSIEKIVDQYEQVFTNLIDFPSR